MTERGDRKAEGRPRARAFPERLSQAMGERGLKQVDLLRMASERGEKLGKSQLSQYVSGKTLPRRDSLGLLADLLGVDAGWLAGAPEGGGAVTREQAPAAPADTPARTAEGGTATASAARTYEEATMEGTHMPQRQFKKSSKLDNVLYDIRGPVLDEAYRMEDQGVHVLKLNIGNPAPFGFRTPDEVVKDMQDQLTECEGYSNSRGLFSARKAIMQYDQLKGIPNVDVEDIYTGNGASELIQLAMNAFMNEGDEILVPSPDYPLWTACATLAGGTAVHYVCDEKADWYPDIDDIRSKVTPRTKGIVVINPNNPTGALYMVAGYRIGWMSLSGNKRIAKDLIDGINMLSNMRLCSNVPAQSIVQTCLGGIQRGQELLVPGGRIYEQREYVYERLSNMEGVTVTKPEAAFYIFPRLDPERFHITDDDQFALDLLKDEHVLVTAGKGFNWETPGYFRIVYLPRKHTLHDAMDKLEDFLSYYRQ